MLRCLTHLEFFSPGPEEAEILTGQRAPREQLRALAQSGPRVTALRLGARGSVVYNRADDSFWSVPAAAANVVDVTGAGNAYCGGFLVGLIEGVNIRQAAAQAAVSAAMVIEQVGPPQINDAVMDEARRRAAEHLKMIKPYAAAYA
jgi:sugar/nucleoside kinase (ribokinase family)